MLTPFTRSLMVPRRPFAWCYDVRSDTTDLTTYTFTNCNLPPVPAHQIIQTATADNEPLIHMSSTGLTAIIIHSEDALATYTVSTVTVGGQTASSGRDNGGAQIVSTAIFFVNSERMQSLSGSDIVVTFSEAVTGCTIAVVGITNLAPNSAVPFGTGTSNATTAGLTCSNQHGTSRVCTDAAVSVLIGSTHNLTTGCDPRTTCATGGRTGLWEPVMLYEGKTSEYSYAGWFAYTNMMMLDNGANSLQTLTDWTGVGSAKDAAAITLF